MAARPKIQQMTTLNGVNLQALASTAGAATRDPGFAKFNFVVKNAWRGGDRNRSTIKEFSGAGDEHRTGVQAFIADNSQPEALLGDDAAPSPYEWLLHALIGCMTTTLAYRSAAAGVSISALDSEAEAELDLGALLGVSIDNGCRPAIRVRMRVRTPAHGHEIEQLARSSPLLQLISRSAPITVSVETY
jgi:uncharacterized OsmC-like protein